MSLVSWPTLLPDPTVDLSIKLKASNITTVMETGRTRRRKRFSATYRYVGVSWEFDDNEFAFFQGFHENKINNGADYFTVNLALGGKGLRTFTAAFASDGDYNTIYQSVLNWKVTAVLEIQLADVISSSEYDALVAANSLASLSSYL